MDFFGCRKIKVFERSAESTWETGMRRYPVARNGTNKYIQLQEAQCWNGQMLYKKTRKGTRERKMEITSGK